MCYIALFWGVCVSGPLFFLFPWSHWQTHTHSHYGGLRDIQPHSWVSWTRVLQQATAGLEPVVGPDPAKPEQGGGGRGGRWRIWTSGPGPFRPRVCGGEIPDEAGAHAVRWVFDRWPQSVMVFCRIIPEASLNCLFIYASKWNPFRKPPVMVFQQKALVNALRCDASER